MSSAVAHCAHQPRALAVERRGQLLFRVDGRTFAFVTATDITVRLGPLRRLSIPPLGIRRARYIGWLGWATITPVDETTLAVARAAIDRSYELACR